MAAAEQACRQVLAINADEPNALQFLGLIHRQKGDEAEAERLMRRSLAVAPDQPHVLNNLGNLLSGQGRSEDALEVYAGAVSLNKDYQEAWRNLGLVQTTMGLLDEARASTRPFQKCITIWPTRSMRRAMRQRPEGGAGAWPHNTVKSIEISRLWPQRPAVKAAATGAALPGRRPFRRVAPGKRPVLRF